MTDEHRQRTLAQNRSLHLWCGMLAEALNDAGFDQKRFLEVANYKLDIPWTTYSVKEILFKPVLEAMTGKESTTEMETVDPTVIHKIVMQRVSELTGVQYINWPDKFDR